jgi:hypothetical protein
MSIPARVVRPDEIMESVLLKGDLKDLTPEERVTYYNEVCKSIGLNPLTKPFEYITLNGRLQLYALRTATDQLRKLNDVSIEILSHDIKDGILTVHARARTPDGRVDEDLGCVAFPDTLRGEIRANVEMKAVTKAKRRVTLSICGLGWLDETEVEDIPVQAKGSATMATAAIDKEPTTISPEQIQDMADLIERVGADLQKFLGVANVPMLKDIKTDQYPELMAKLQEKGRRGRK